MMDGNLGDEIAMPTMLSGVGGIGTNKGTTFYTADSAYDFYAVNSIGLYGVKAEVQKDGSFSCVTIECINWLNSDIAPASVKDLCIADENTVSVLRELNGECQLSLLTKIPPEEIEKRQIITIASISEADQINKIIQYAVEKFNRSSSNHRIVVIDFTQYDKDRRTLLFNAEIAVGNVPDIVVLSTEAGTDITAYNYMRSGIYCDLIPLMQTDDTFDFENLLGFASKPYQIDGGKQYFFPLTPSAATQFGNTAYFNGPVTAEETFSSRDNLAEGVNWTRNENVFKMRLLQSIMEDYVNFDEMSCRFDDGGFSSVLQKCEELPEKGTLDDLQTDDACFAAMKNGKLRLYDYDAKSLYRYVTMRHYMGGEIVAVGYPNESRRLYADNSAGTFFAITEISKNKDEALNFLECIFKSFGENNYNEGNYAFFKSDIERQMKKYDGKTIVFYQGKALAYDDKDANELPGEHIKLTCADADEYCAYLDSIDALLPIDSPIYAIYEEECFSGYKRSPDAISKAIQSRVSIYLSEQS